MPPYRKQRRFPPLLSYTTFFEMPPTFLERPLPYHVYGQSQDATQQPLLEEHPIPPKEEL